MPRSRKQPANVVAVSEVKVTQVLITRQQYIEDIKVRWQIHTYEVNRLAEDLKKGFEYLKQFTNTFSDKLFYTVTDQ